MILFLLDSVQSKTRLGWLSMIHDIAQTSLRSNEWTKDHMKKRTNKRTNGHTNKCTDARMAKARTDRVGGQLGGGPRGDFGGNDEVHLLCQLIQK